MAGKTINGMINNQGDPSAGDKFTSSVLSQDPYAVVATFKNSFENTPIGLASVAGNDTAGPALALQASTTSLVIQTDSSTAVPIYFSVTDKRLGYYSSK